MLSTITVHRSSHHMATSAAAYAALFLLLLSSTPSRGGHIADFPDAPPMDAADSDFEALFQKLGRYYGTLYDAATTTWKTSQQNKKYATLTHTCTTLNLHAPPEGSPYRRPTARWAPVSSASLAPQSSSSLSSWSLLAELTQVVMQSKHPSSTVCLPPSVGS